MSRLINKVGSKENNEQELMDDEAKAHYPFSRSIIIFGSQSSDPSSANFQITINFGFSKSDEEVIEALDLSLHLLCIIASKPYFLMSRT